MDIFKYIIDDKHYYIITKNQYRAEQISSINILDADVIKTHHMTEEAVEFHWTQTPNTPIRPQRPFFRTT